jgi:5-methylcytosine-specific restriction endonuclease McrA
VKKLEAAWFLCDNASIAGGGANFTEVTHPSGCEGLTQHPDVDHIEPCIGKHGVWGCHHHQSNLRVLCPPCHKKVTAAQATARAAARRKAKS